MPQRMTIGLAQSHTLSSLSLTLSALRDTTKRAVAKGVSILLFPEAYLGGYPRTCSFGTLVGSRSDTGRDQFLAYAKSAVDLGDTPNGAGDAWIENKLPVDEVLGQRGDGTREYLEKVARETGVFIITGVVEKAGGSLYCAALYVDPERGVIGKRRKLMPTGSERLVWGQGAASTLKAVTTTINGIRVVIGCAICWENYMPLLRYSLYSQGVNLWLAPTADPRPTWQSLMQTIAFEGRCFVLGANQCVKKKNLPRWIAGTRPVVEDQKSRTLANGLLFDIKTEETHKTVGNDDNNIPTWRQMDDSAGDGEQFVSIGGSCIVNPFGETIAGPIWEREDDLLYVEVDFDDCDRGHLDFDVTGHYSRPDAFKLTVEGLDLNPLW